MQLKIDTLVKEIQRQQASHIFDKYITEARFPNFKNLEANASIKFTFPLTLLVGTNGSGKSSILHALWGMPYGYSTNRFWFATDIDPIKEEASAGQNRYNYTFYEKSVNQYFQAKKIESAAKLAIGNLHAFR